MANSKLFPILLIVLVTISLIISIVGAVISQNIVTGIFTATGLLALLAIGIFWLKNKPYSKWLIAFDLILLICMTGSLCSIIDVIRINDIILNMVVSFLIGMIFTSHVLRIFLHNKLEEKKTETII